MSWLDPGNMTAKLDRKICGCVFCKTYKLREQPKMVTNPATPCKNPDCWCQRDKNEPLDDLGKHGLTPPPEIRDPTITIEWDKYGYAYTKTTPLGGFDWDRASKPVPPKTPDDLGKDIPKPSKTIFDGPSTTPFAAYFPKPSKTIFDGPSGPPFAAYFYDKDTPSWNESPFPGEYRERDPFTGGEKGKKLAELGAIDPASLLELAKVAGYGSQKYARLNYMKGYKWSLSYDAMQRHLLAFWNGESIDPESGLDHLAHAAWHCMTLMSYDRRDLGTDDRYEDEEPFSDR